MKRGDARELAVHLIYGRAFTGEEPEQVVSTRLDKEYYGKLAEENEVYAQRPDRFQLRYIDSVVTGVAVAEAVRIAKKYDGDDTGAFINGILGSFVRSRNT